MARLTPDYVVPQTCHPTVKTYHDAVMTALKAASVASDLVAAEANIKGLLLALQQFGAVGVCPLWEDAVTNTVPRRGDRSMANIPDTDPKYWSIADVRSWMITNKIPLTAKF